MRAKIDVSEVEASTKIRAKYLRALENEEWGLLPGPTFVRSFLRTYADYLGLDSRLLVEEYRVRHEGPSELDLAPISPNLGSERRARLRAPALSRGWIVGLALVAILALLIVIGSVGGGGSGGGSNQVATQSSTAKARPQPKRPAPAPRPTVARLKLMPADPVYVCLVDSSGRRLIDGAVLAPGSPTSTFKAKRFSVLFGHGPQQMRVNGRTVSVPSSSAPIGFEITPAGRRELSQTRLPTCSQ